MRDDPREAGLLLIPMVLFFTITMGAAFLLRPSLDHEQWNEGRRLQHDRARAAAEGAAELALHFGRDVADEKIDGIPVRATLRREGEATVVEAEAQVPSFRGTVVTVAVTRRR